MALTVILPSGVSNTGNFSVGSLSASGNVNGANIIATTLSATGNVVTVGIAATGNISTTGNITGGNFIGAIAGTSSSLTGNITANNGMFTNIVNVASHTGAVVSVTGNVTANNGIFTNIVNVASHTGTLVSVTGNVTANNGMFTNIVNVASHTGTLVSVTGNITGGNVAGGSIIATPGNAYFKSSGTDNFTISTFTNTPNPNFNINIGNGAGGIDRNPIYWNIGLSFSGNGRADTGTPDVKIDSAGNVSAVGTIIVNSRGNATAIVNGAGNAVGNIGSSTTYFNQLFAQATTALYADLAEMYTADAEYAPGTVLIFGGNQEVTMSTVTHDTRVAGVVSTNPAHIMNSGLQGTHTVAVALTGRVPVSVIGNITKGDRVVTSSRAGVAEALDMSRYQPGVIIGKALQNYSGNSVGVIEVVVGRL